MLRWLRRDPLKRSPNHRPSRPPERTDRREAKHPVSLPTRAEDPRATTYATGRWTTARVERRILGSHDHA